VQNPHCEANANSNEAISVSAKKQPVFLPASFRVILDTPHRLRWLLIASLLLHLVLTPMMGWVGLVGLLFPEEPEAFVEEDLETIPIELFQPPAEAQEPSAPELPELPQDDPVGLIEETTPNPIPLPIKPRPVETAAAPPSAAQPEASAAAEPSATATAAPPSASAEPPPAPSASTSAAPSASATPEQPAEQRPIDGPIEAAGKAGEVLSDQAYVSITLHADRIREHPVGQRIAGLLPSLPQWNDFFPDESLNPVRDFDRVVVVGPSFSNSANVIALLEYNAPQKRIKGAIDKLVKRNGEWLSNQKVPVARAYADRAERVFILPRPGLVVVVPPNKQRQMLAVQDVGIPKPKGPEAMEATLVNPHKPFARYGLQIPKSIKEARIRVTPLPNGEVKIELQARDATPEDAAKNALEIASGINALADLSAGFAGLLELAGLGHTVKLPRVKLEARGSEIWGEQVLTAEQVDFLLTQFERQAMVWSQARRPPPEPKPRNAEGAKPQPSSVRGPRPPSRR
jgi:hypothetical protein